MPGAHACGWHGVSRCAPTRLAYVLLSRTFTGRTKEIPSGAHRLQRHIPLRCCADSPHSPAAGQRHERRVLPFQYRSNRPVLQSDCIIDAAGLWAADFKGPHLPYNRSDVAHAGGAAKRKRRKSRQKSQPVVLYGRRFNAATLTQLPDACMEAVTYLADGEPPTTCSAPAFDLLHDKYRRDPPAVPAYL